MTTLRWQSVPVQQTVQTWVGAPLAPRALICVGCGLTSFQEPSVKDYGVFVLCNDCYCRPLPSPLLKKAQERLDLMDELRDVRADRDRYIARCAELERRLEAVREAVQ
jgi:hypothetical protein